MEDPRLRNLATRAYIGWVLAALPLLLVYLSFLRALPVTLQKRSIEADAGEIGEKPE